MAFSARSTRFRLFVLLGFVGIFLLAFPSLHSFSGRPLALVPLSFPVLAMAWFYGLRGGLIASLVSIPVSIIMVNLVDDTLTRGTILFHSTMVTPTLFRVTAACLLGGLRDVYQKVKKSEVALEAANVDLEAQVATRTKELSKQQEVISEGQSLAKFGTIERDLQTGEGWWSDEVYRILGIAPQESAPTTETFLEQVHPHDIELLKEMVTKSRKTGNRDGEFRIIRSSGEELTVHSRAKVHHDEEGNPVRLIATMLDITERKQAETKMKTTQDRLSSALDGLPGGLWDWNVVTGEVYFSDKWCQSLGYQREEVNPHVSFWEQIVHPDDFSRVMEQMEAHLRGESEVYECENRLRTKSGNYRWNLDRGRVVSWSADGKPLRMVGVDLDINERREVQEKLEKTQKELSNLSKHLIQAQEEERRRIALELHDQLGQDLALLSIEIERLMQKAPKSQVNQLKNLAIKNRAISTYVQTLSHQLHPSSLEHLGLVAASRSLCKEVSKTSTIQIDFSHTSVPRPIPQDVSICLYRVLQESLTNIVKHSEVQAAQVELAGSPDKLQLHVCDSGVGFDPESVGNDGGLGFVSMRERLNLVGGELLIESQPSVGTQIKACVPLNSSASPFEHPTEVQEA